MPRCKCLGDILIDSEYYIDDLPLKNGGHTRFNMLKCSKCGAWRGFPDGNLDIFLTQGDDDLVKQLIDKFNLG